MPLPRFVRRLFQNDGYGPKLQSEIIPWDDEKRFTALEAWRQAMIGTPMPMTSTTLPAGYMWADGSLASFAIYPELKAKYDAGGFEGMLLAYDATEADMAAYPGKWVPDADNPTGLFVPRLNGLFARYCGQEGAGGYNKPGLPNVTGVLDYGVHGPSAWTTAGCVLVGQYLSSQYAATTKAPGVRFAIDASKSNTVYGASDTVMPASWESPVALYLGRAAEV